ncbi:hypothetical protein [Cesiribacter andamanensis]|uniref:MetA-pathway of phenol degradation n=1 Tax=Cesiribacter andamanensis AMV16 TaxID=1279009 RepID=M7P039_9BACT|nr:hypothetical protein [Cesiribacter andamanensis]EMR03984.1 hypothetical protein ADICEAN_00855 [Cesiribacter andamanensis AMV16]
MLLTKLLLGGMVLCAPVLAGAEALFTDRIGLAEDAQMTLPRRWSLEAGLNAAWAGTRLGSSSAFGVPSLLLRGALSEGVELRLATEYLMGRQLNRASLDQPVLHSGINYVSLGTKLTLLNERSLIPQTALMGMMGLKEAGPWQEAGREALLSVRLLSDKSFGDKKTLSLNAGLSRAGSGAAWEGDNTLTFGYQATKKMECFAEAWNSWYAGYHQLGANVGLFARPFSLIRLELIGGIGYDGDTPQLILSGGLAIKTQ